MAVAVAGPFKALFGAIEIKTSFESKKIHVKPVLGI